MLNFNPSGTIYVFVYEMTPNNGLASGIFPLFHFSNEATWIRIPVFSWSKLILHHFFMPFGFTAWPSHNMQISDNEITI
jgi:hypothetical protein